MTAVMLTNASIANRAGNIRLDPRVLERCQPRRPPTVGEDLRDEKSGDHEKHVDADKAAAKARDVKMEQDHRDDSDGAQSVDFGTVRVIPGRAPPVDVSIARVFPI